MGRYRPTPEDARRQMYRPNGCPVVWHSSAAQVIKSGRSRAAFARAITKDQKGCRSVSTKVLGRLNHILVAAQRELRNSGSNGLSPAEARSDGPGRAGDAADDRGSDKATDRRAGTRGRPSHRSEEGLGQATYNTLPVITKDC